MTPVRLEPAAPRSRVKHSTTEPLRSLSFIYRKVNDRKRSMSMIISLYGSTLIISNVQFSVFVEAFLQIFKEITDYNVQSVTKTGFAPSSFVL